MIKQPPPVGQMISEISADLTARGSQAFVDDDFAHDVEKGIESQRQSSTAILGVVLDSSVLSAAALVPQ